MLSSAVFGWKSFGKANLEYKKLVRSMECKELSIPLVESLDYYKGTLYSASVKSGDDHSCR